MLDSINQTAQLIEELLASLYLIVVALMVMIVQVVICLIKFTGKQFVNQGKKIIKTICQLGTQKCITAIKRMFM